MREIQEQAEQIAVLHEFLGALPTVTPIIKGMYEALVAEGFTKAAAERMSVQWIVEMINQGGSE